MSKNIDNDLDYKQAFNKLLDLFMYNEIEESKMFINIISKEIDFKTQMRNQLLCNKPFKFQKKKTQQYNKELEELEDEILQCYKNIELELTDAALEKIAEEGYDPQYGARPIRRALQKHVEDRLSEELLKGTVLTGQVVVFDYKNDEFIVRGKETVNN